MPPASSMLSPLAMPFTPTRPGYEEYASFAAIYNDGIPAGVVVGNHADHEIIHNIPDVALEEIFPPSATEAAELDAVDDFIATIVHLSFLEDDEEMTRNDFGHSFKKRWEARRKLGLIGRPHQATTSKSLANLSHSMLNPNEEKLVCFDRHRRAHANIENKLRFTHNAEKKILAQNRHQMNRNGSNYGNFRPIQQPRKMN